VTRRTMTEADWLAVARVFFAIHQRRRAADTAASVPAADSRRERLADMAVANARARREAAAGDGDHDAA